MVQNPLKVISGEPKALSRRQKAEKKFETLWKRDPEHFDPKRNAMERERLARTLELLPMHLEETRVVDLGCGNGILSKKLRDRGASVDAVDIANEPLARLASEKKIATKQDYVPTTSLEDDRYDGVLCTELIAYLPSDEYRLLFSEIARIVKPSGFVICSTPLDYRSVDPLQRFASLAETEFTIENWIFSYHLFYIRLRNFFEAPHRFIRAKNDEEYRRLQLDLREGFSKTWFRINSHAIGAFLWRPIQWLSKPIAKRIRQSRGLLLGLEKFCSFIWSDSGMTHAIFLGKRRTLEKIPEDERPIEPKHKKEVWE